MEHLSAFLKKIAGAFIFAMIVMSFSFASPALDPGLLAVVSFLVVFFVLYVFEEWDED